MAIAELKVNRSPEKIYFTISEVANRYGCATSKIRFWCDHFGVVIPRNRKGVRQFNRGNIIELDKIHWLVEKEEYTLPGAMKKLPTIKHSPYDTVTTDNQNEKGGDYLHLKTE